LEQLIKNMHKQAFIILILLTFSFCASAQDFSLPDTTQKQNTKAPFWSWQKIYVGGDLGLLFGNITMVNIAPIVGYKITDRYSAGVGIRYLYFADNYAHYALNIYGGSLFNRFILTDFLFAHAEYEVLNGAWNPASSNRFNLVNIWGGGGLQQSMGNSSFNIMALWNFNESIYNPFPNPQIRVGANIGL
jgi:long-subunit fatty acid transport protein